MEAPKEAELGRGGKLKPSFSLLGGMSAVKHPEKNLQQLIHSFFATQVY